MSSIVINDMGDIDKLHPTKSWQELADIPEQAINGINRINLNLKTFSRITQVKKTSSVQGLQLERICLSTRTNYKRIEQTKADVPNFQQNLILVKMANS